MTPGMDLQEIYNRAAGFHRNGELGEASAMYAQVLREFPEHFEALEGLAQIRFQTGDARGAAELLQRAIAIQPGSQASHANLGIALAGQGLFDDAIRQLRHALALNPNAPEILMYLGRMLATAGALAEAIEAYRKAILLCPTNAKTHYNMGGAQISLGTVSAGIESFRLAIALRPDFVEAHNELANALMVERTFDQAAAAYRRTIELRADSPDALNNLAVALHELGCLDDAVAASEKAIALRPSFPDAYYNLGRIRQDQKLQEQAEEAYRQAIALRPDFAEAFNNLAMTFQARGLFDEALESYRRAMAVRPDYEDPWINLGVALKESGRVEEAISHYDHVLAKWPGSLEARWNMGMTLLLSGDFERGWPAAETRRRISRLECDRQFREPQWKGEPLEGRPILLHAEQGFGDAIQFIRYAPMVRERGGVVIVQCQAELARLFSGQPGIDQVVGETQPLPTFDLHCPLLSLPHVFGTTASNIPAGVPYLHPDQSLVDRWARKVGKWADKLKVGIVWAGNPRHINDSLRSIPEAELSALGNVTGVQYFTLQKGPGSRQGAAPVPIEWIDFTAELSDFSDTAALIANLDLVISVDTAVGHLAGAMGKRVWLLLPFAPDWRWMVERNDSPWYPTMRLFRQRAWGDWPTVIMEVAANLADGAPIRDAI